MKTLHILQDGTRLFNTGKAHLGDGLFYGLVLRNETEKQAQKSLKKIVPYNTTLHDLIIDMKEHNCGTVKIITDDDGIKIWVGFKCACGTKWRIPLAELKACIVHFPEYREKIRSTESRKLFAKSLTKV